MAPHIYETFFYNVTVGRTHCFYFCPCFLETFSSGSLYNSKLFCQQIIGKRQMIISLIQKKLLFSTLLFMIAMTLINFRRVFKKKPIYFPPGNVKLNNLIDPSKTKDWKGEIYLVHCRGHDCII